MAIQKTAALPGSIEDRAARDPDGIAVIEGDRRLSWGEWNVRADRLAAGLAARGIARGDIVVVRTQIRLEWPVIASALAKLGCALLGLNWRLTPDETKYVLSNSGANALICDDPDPGALRPALEGLPIKLAVSLDAEADGFVPYGALFGAPAEPRFTQGDPPLIIYTSGTTGLPRGVVMRQGLRAADPRVLEYLQDVRDRRPAGSGGPVLINMPMHHGSGPAQVWGALRTGSTIVLQRRFDPEQALALIERYRIATWTGVPTMYKRLAGLPQEVLARYDVSSIQHLGVGAAPVPYSLKGWIIAHFGPCLSEGYGSTEVGMITYLPPEDQQARPGSSGRPHRHVEIRVRDREGRDLPPGEVGELWVKTPMAIDAYLNGPKLGLDTIDADGFFRMGDMGRLDEDGYLYITDRAKDMIISGGVNIYPAEIEAALLRHAAVQDAAVIGIPDDEFGESVLAYCELKPGQAATAEALLRHCTQHLASYKRPRRIEIVRELPRNTMGKLLKRELREPFWKGRERKV